MPRCTRASQLDIDFVVAWVDGDDPKHQAKMAAYLPEGTDRRRLFKSVDEIRLCLRSMRNYAPWARRIWIVTDAQFPKSINRWLARLEGVRVVDHKVIFRDTPDVLPIFNSIAIASAIHKIPDLADRFVYFNDDTFLLNPVQPADFFTDAGQVIIRGYAGRVFRTDAGVAPRLRAGEMLGLSRKDMVRSPHIPKPMLKHLIIQLQEKFPEEFRKNSSFRSRDVSHQFLASELHNHYALLSGAGLLQEGHDWLHISVDSCEHQKPKFLMASARDAKAVGKKFLCVNDLPMLASRYRQALRQIASLTGPPRLFEKSAGIAERAKGARQLIRNRKHCRSRMP